MFSLQVFFWQHLDGITHCDSDTPLSFSQDLSAKGFSSNVVLRIEGKSHCRRNNKSNNRHMYNVYIGSTKMHERNAKSAVQIHVFCTAEFNTPNMWLITTTLVRTIRVRFLALCISFSEYSFIALHYEYT